ncbi:cupredoxin family protein [Saccharophagus degradans]|uniref:cupredoxin domain-containing protein n=1 Tax=Saccharophagus degradans TaxID=86304 RepID=UPI0024781281|nr:cupredoxin family protein [Saccharophagus degradans]WGO96877.1 cupredoxin family protein [Saccharophagus degradans]
MYKIILILTLIIPTMSFASGEHKHEHHDHHSISSAGEPAESDEINRTINVKLLDSMQFKFETDPAINSGEVIKFVVSNAGKIPHEFSIGTPKEHLQHRVMMRKNPKMKHTDGNTITVAPGETGELVWRFGKLDTVLVACNIPGHFEAGMKYSVHLN